MASDLDLWTVMRRDHALLWKLINELTGGKGVPSGTAKEHRRVAKQLVAAASAHEAAEELVVWPVVRRLCSDGEALIEAALSQEEDAKSALHELNHISAGNQEFEECLHTLAGLARTHISYEENQIWPRLADELDPATARQLADRFLAARRLAPTRPHPNVPARPGVLGTVGIVAARLDHARDVLTRRRVPSP